MWKATFGGVVAAVLASSSGWTQEQPADETPIAAGVQVEVQPNVEGRPQALANGRPTDSYWLGLRVSAISDDERRERRVPKGEGVMVAAVMADSPAARAGFKSQDVVLKVGKKVIKDAADVTRAIRESKGQKLTIELIRDGKRQTLSVTPESRGNTPESRGKEPADGTAKTPDSIRWLSRPEPSLPDDMTVTIIKSGKNLAQVVAKQGNKEWEADEQDLDKLPKTARPYVERLLQHPRTAARGGPALLTPPTAISPKATILPSNAAMEKRIQEMNRRIDKLQQTIEELRKNPAPGKGRPDEEKK